MRKQLTIAMLLLTAVLFGQEWIIPHTNLPYVIGPTGNIPIGDQYGMVMKGNTVCYAGGSGGWITTNLGESWTKVVETGAYTVTAVAVHSTLNEIYFCKNKFSDTCMIVKTANNGGNFSIVHKKKGVIYQELAVTKKGTLLAFVSAGYTGGGTIYRSENGIDWTEKPMEYYTAAQVKVYGDTILMAGTGSYGGFYYSVDDGLTFTKKKIMPSGIKSTHSICKAPNGDIFVGGYTTGSTNGEIYRSSDFGDTWSLVYTAPASATPIYDIEALPNGELFACMILRGIARSTNQGASWSIVATDGEMELGVGSNGKIHGIKGGYLAYLGFAPTGMNTNAMSGNAIVFYPNPTKGDIFAKNIKANSEYTILNSNGAVLKQGITSGEICFQNLPSGCYYVCVNNSICKVVKDKSF